jgi:hypothetical protein
MPEHPTKIKPQGKWISHYSEERDSDSVKTVTDLDHVSQVKDCHVRMRWSRGTVNLSPNSFLRKLG